VSAKDVPTSGRFPLYYPGRDNEEMYAQGQSVGEKALRGVTQMVGIAGTTFINGTVGLVNGVTEIVKQGGKLSAFYDNDMTRSFDEFNNSWNDKYALYKTERERTGSWWEPENLFTANFLFDNIVKNMGFMAGAAASGFTFGAGFKVAGAAMKAMGITANLMSAGAEVAATADAIIAEAGNDEQLTKLLVDFTMEKTDDDKSWDISRDIMETGKLILNENNREEITHFQNKKIEDFIDNLKILDETSFNIPDENIKNHNPEAIIEPNNDSKIWIKSLYKNILDTDVTDEDEGLRHWLTKIEQNVPKEQIENYFRQVAQQEVQKNQKIELKDLFDNDENLKRVLIVQPESIGDIFLLTSIFESIRNRYPSSKYKIYISTKPEYKDLLDGNPYIDKWIPYHQIMDNAIAMEGGMGQKGVCDIVYNPYFATQRLLSYMHNGEDKIDLEFN
jgi:hypothetical protein